MTEANGNTPMKVLTGVAQPWQCDVLGHLTTRFYVALFDDASYHFLFELFGWSGASDDEGRRAFVDARHVIDYRAEPFRPRVLELTDGRGADVIYDSVGGETTDESLRCIAWNGRLLVVGFASGTIPDIQANRILLKNIAVTGVHWSAYAEREPELVDPTFEALFALHEEGLIDPLISAVMPLDRVTDALEALGSRKTHGKVILTP